MNFDELVDESEAPGDDVQVTGATPQQPAQETAPQSSFDELPDDRENPEAVASGEQSEALPSFDDMPDDRGDASDGEWSQAGSFGAGVAKGAVPTTGGLAAGLLAGAAATPLTGPIGGLAVGLGVGMGAGWLLDMGQDKLLALMGVDKPLQKARADNPHSFDLGTMAPAAALLRPNMKQLDLAARGIGAGLGTVIEGGMQAVHGEFDPTKIGMAAGMGAALPRTNVAGSKVLATGEQMGERLSAKLYRGEGGRYRGGNKNPDLKPIAEEEAITGRPDEPAPQQDEITLANDEPTVAAGIALEQQAPPEIIGAGNPVGSPGAQRVAAKPSDPERNYQKDQPVTHPDTIESKVIDTEPLKGDIKAALENGGDAHTAPPVDSANGAAPHGADVPPEGAAPTRPMSEDGAIELSRVSRQAEANVAKKMASQQKGELFDGLPQKDSPDVVPRSEPVAAPKETGPLKPEQAKSLAEDRAIMAKAGWERALAALDQKTPREQFDFLNEHRNAARQELAVGEGKKASEAEARRPDGELRKESRQKVAETGVLARDKKDAARKSAAIKVTTSAYDDMGPRSERGKTVDPLNGDTKAVRAYTKEVWAEVLKRNGGRDPLVRSPDQYVPIQKGEHSDAYQWLKAVKASAKGQNHKNFATLHSVEGMGKVDAETGRVEGDIARRPQINETGAEIETANDAGRDTARKPLEDWADPDQMESKVYGEQQQKLRDWVNDLDDVDHRLLSDIHEDLAHNVNATQDPHELLRNFQDDLAAAQKRRPKGELTSEVELPPKRVQAPHLPSEVEPPVGRTLDKNSDEFKRLAAQYNEQAPKGPAKPKAEQVQDLNAKERSAAEAINGSTHEGLIDKVKQFVGDESGAGFLHRMFSQPANPSSPAALPGAKEYAESLSIKFRDRSAETKNTKLEIMANLARAADADIKPHEHRKIALAEQDNRTGALPQKLKDFYDNHVAPVRQRAMDVMRDFKVLNDAENLGYDLPNLNAVTTKAYQPRYQIDKQHFNRKDTDAFDPFTGQGLGDYSPNLEDRKFFSVEKGNDRMVVEITGDKDAGYGVNIHRGPSNVTKLANLPASFDGKLGDVLNLNVKGQKGKWIVDQATTKEIEGATGLKYYENAAWAWSKMLDDMTRAYENAKLTAEIKSDPRFKDLTTTDPAVAKEKGWSSKVTTHLPDFATSKGTQGGQKVYMPDAVRWAFDDYHKPGFGGLTSEGIEKMRNFNVALLKVFNTNAPLVHVLNELDLFIVGRGFKWINPKAYYDMAVAAPTAFKDVNSQGPIQREMRNAGVNPMLASVSMRTMYETAAKNFGMEIIKNHSQWDPIAKVWGVSTKEIGQKMYDLSSDVTWRLSDYLTTIRYLEEKANGLGPQEAAKKVNKFMSDYHLGTTVMGSRVIQQMIAEPAVTAFGRYKAGIFRSLSHMTRDLLAPSATKQERIDALGQWLVMGALGYMVYPAADALVRKVTGNDGGELRRRGVTSVADAAKNIVTGEKDPAAMLTRAWTPAPALNAALDVAKNKDFTGKAIMPQGEWPGVLPEAAAGVAEYGLKTAVPPYGTISQHYARPEGTPGGAIGAFAFDQIGVGLPSEAGNKRQGRIEKVNSQAHKARQKRPGGMIPDLMNRVTD